MQFKSCYPKNLLNPGADIELLNLVKTP